jgi:single-strand DNA-binding protein
MNKTFHIGNLTRDPEASFSSGGKAITKFSLAVNGRGDKVNFFDYTAFEKTAENIAKFKKKGDSLLVEGRLETDTWEDKSTGQKRSKTYVIAENVQFLGGKSDGAEKPAGSSAKPASKAAPEQEESDIPF